MLPFRRDYYCKEEVGRSTLSAGDRTEQKKGPFWTEANKGEMSEEGDTHSSSSNVCVHGSYQCEAASVVTWRCWATIRLLETVSVVYLCTGCVAAGRLFISAT